MTKLFRKRFGMKLCLDLFLVLSLIAVLSLSGCGGGGGDSLPIGGGGGGGVSIPATTKVLDSATINNLSNISEDGSVLTFSGSTAQLDSLTSGDIIVIGTNNATPNGLLRKVTSISESAGSINVTTTQATIEEAIENGTISTSQALIPGNTSSALALRQGVVLSNQSHFSSMESEFYIQINDVVLYDHDGDPNTTNDQIKANGSVSFATSFDFNMTIRNYSLKRLNFTNQVVNTATIELNAQANILDIEKEIEIARWRFTPITVWVGYVPVVIVPVLTVNIGLDGKVSLGLSSSVTQQVTITTGVSYDNGQWNPISEYTESFEFMPPTLLASAHAKAYAGPKLSLMLYGVAGPYAEAKGYLELEADMFATPWWTLHAGIEANAGVKIEIFSNIIAGYELSGLISYRRLLAQADTTPQTGAISGVVKNAVSGEPLEGVTIQVRDQSSEIASGVTNSNGTYTVSVPSGSGYRIVFIKTGYINANYHNISIEPLETKYLEAVLQIDTAYAGSGNISGNILNALSGLGVSGLTVTLRDGINVTTGATIATTVTGSGGAYSFSNMPGGNYSAQVSGADYNTAVASLICIGGTTSSNQNITVTPILSSDEIRIILTWGASPRDLDSHLTGPKSDGTRFHVYYAGTHDYARLDLDDTDGYGPETTTIYQQISGVYRFTVHDYSNRSSSNSLALSNSEAQVRVYNGSNLIANFNVPPNQGGTVWTVFEMNNTTLTPINTMSYESNSTLILSVRSGQSIHDDLDLLRNLPIKR